MKKLLFPLLFLAIPLSGFATDPERLAEIANLNKDMEALRARRLELVSKPASLAKAKEQARIESSLSTKEAVIKEKRKAGK